MKRFSALVLFFLLFAPPALASFSDIALEVKVGENVSICARQTYAVEVIKENGEKLKDIEWTASNENIVWVRPDDSIMGVGIGSATLTGKAKDGSGEQVKIKVSIPKVYTTHDNVVVDTPEGIEFGYAFNLSGYLSVSAKGNCFRCDPIDDVGEINMSRIMPVKAGTGSLIFSANGKTIKTVKIEVKKLALQPVATSTPDTQAPKSVVDVHDTSFPSEKIEKAVEERLDHYIVDHGLTDECKAVIIQYLPNVNDFDMIVQSGYQGYDIIMNDGTIYYLTVMKDKTPACLQSSEKDYKARTRYYDKFAK